MGADVPGGTSQSNSTQAVPAVFAVLPDGNVILAGTVDHRVNIDRDVEPDIIIDAECGRGRTTCLPAQAQQEAQALRQASPDRFHARFGTSLDAAAATNAANYEVATVTIKRIKGKKQKFLHPIANFALSYTAGSDAVEITLGSKQTFPTGGQITVLGSLTTVAGDALTSTAAFSIAKGGKSVVPS